ncbi:unnamed protein product [Malus baccata var. baccata]
MGDPLGSSSMSSYKQNREGVVGAQTSSSESNPRMGDPLENSCMSSQKQNREDVVGAQSGQYRVTAESSPRCGGSLGRNVTILVKYNKSLILVPFQPIRLMDLNTI